MGRFTLSGLFPGQANKFAKKVSIATKLRWDSTSSSRKIAKTFEAETDGLDIAQVEAYFILMYSLWISGNHQSTTTKLKQITETLKFHKFKKRLSRSTKQFFNKLFKLMPKGMRNDRSVKPFLKAIRKKIH